MKDFKELVEEMKMFFNVTSLEDVSEKLGYGRFNATAWRRNRRISSIAMRRYEALVKKRDDDYKYGLEEEMDAKELRMIVNNSDLSKVRIATLLGITRQQLHNLENAKMRISPEIAFKARHLHEELEEPESALEKLRDCYQIEMLDLYVSAGSGIPNFETCSIGILELQKIFFKTPQNQKHLKAIKVIGDSMSPTINDGDWVVINIDLIHNKTDGIYVIAIDNEIKIKRLQFLRDKIEIISDNKIYKSIEITKNDENFKIIGKCVFIMSNDI